MVSVRDTVYPLPPEEVPSWVQSNQAGLYIFVVLTTVIVYDALCTMDREVKYFWGKPLNMTHIVFFLNRYGGIFGSAVAMVYYFPNVNLPSCNLSTWGMTFGGWAVVIGIDYILMVRCLALYSNSKGLSRFLFTLLVLEAAAKAYVTSERVITAGSQRVRLSSGDISCAESFIPKTVYYVLDGTLPLAFETLLLALTLFKATKYWKLNGFQGSQLVLTLVRDQVLYYLLVIINTIFSLVDNSILTDFVPGAILSAFGNNFVLCILASRLCFNLKEAAEHGVNKGTNWYSHTYTDVCFQEPGPEGETMDSAAPFVAEESKV